METAVKQSGRHDLSSCQSYEQFTDKLCRRGKWIVIRKKSEGKIIIKRSYIPCGTYSCFYCREKKRRKLYKLIKNACPKSEFNMLTLTLRKNGDPLVVNWKRLSKAWDILLKRIRRKSPKVAYFRCVELQKNGMPHIHALINFYLPKWYIQLIWKKITGDSFICRFEHVRQSCSGYILKYYYQALKDISYIRKTTGKKTRIFNYSRNLLKVADRHPTWELLGMCRSRYEASELLRGYADSSRLLYGRISPLDMILDEYDTLESIQFFSVEVSNS